MEYLVQFKQDNTLFVCNGKNIKKNKNTECVWVKFYGRFYKARILISHVSKALLDSMLNQLSSKSVVILDNILILPLCDYELDLQRGYGNLLPNNAQGENRPLSGPLDNTIATGLDFSFDEIVDWLNSPNDFLLDQQNLSVGAPFVENVSPNQLEEASCSAMDSSHRNNIDPVTNFGDENEHSISDSGSLYSPNDEEGLASFQTNKLHSHEGKKTQSTNASINVPKPSGIVNVCHVESSSSKTKKYFCIYCHKRVTKISRHLENVHKDEDEVKKFLNLPKGTAERKRIIHLLRSAGSFIYNTNSSFNKGNLQVSRRPQMPKNRTAYDYIICPHCKESYSKISLRRHVKKCLDTESKEKNSITVMGRRIRADIHPVACNVLRDQIYPYLRDDDVIRCIKYDDFVIRFFNEQCLKYRSGHHHKMIRSEMRLLGRFLLKLMEIEPSVKNISDIFIPKFFDQVLEAIASLGELDENLNIMKKPNVPLFLGTLLKKLAAYHKSFSIIKNDIPSQKHADDFLCLFNTHFNPHINQTVIESKLHFSRQKIQELPSDGDIQKLMLHILKNIKSSYDKLVNDFQYNVWRDLSSFSLLWIICFNRRRVGEVERMKVEDFKNFQRVDKFADENIYNSLSNEGKQAAEDFVRVQLRGKLGRTVPLLLCKLVFHSIILLLRFRKHASIQENNPYVFALPGQSRNRYLEACSLLREHSIKCGASKPHLLRGTNLRKHIATKSVLLNLNDREISDLANYMGHNEKIHKSFYRLPIVAREIIEISKILIKAQGDEEDKSGNISMLATGSEDILDLPIVEFQKKSSMESSMKKRMTAMFLPSSTKKPWNSLEKEMALKIFSKHISSGKSPKISECHEAINNCSALDARSPQSLKAWVNNQMNKNVSDTIGSVRRPWNNLETEILNKHFSLNYSTGRLPSLKECQEAMEKFSGLTQRTPTVIKAKIHNDLKRRRLN